MMNNEEKLGTWDFVGDNLYQCSKCGYVATSDWLHKWQSFTSDPYFPKACPNCGVKMRTEYDDDII